MTTFKLPPKNPNNANDPRNDPHWKNYDAELQQFLLEQAGLLPKTVAAPVDPYYAGRQQLALQLFKARTRRHLTQAAAAQKVGLSQPAYARIEAAKANPTINTVLKIAAAFDLELSLQPAA